MSGDLMNEGTYEGMLASIGTTPEQIAVELNEFRVIRSYLMDIAVFCHEKGKKLEEIERIVGLPAGEVDRELRRRKNKTLAKKGRRLRRWNISYKD